MADMLNAASERDNARLFDDNEHAAANFSSGFTMITTKKIDRQAQIVSVSRLPPSPPLPSQPRDPATHARYNTYASPPNSELLRKYGHVDVFPLEPEQINLLDSAAWPFGNPGDEVELGGDLIVGAITSTSIHLEDRVDRWLEEGQEE
jgi:SET domain-containing protein 6